jgi:hypothetical protein
VGGVRGHPHPGHTTNWARAPQAGHSGGPDRAGAAARHHATKGAPSSTTLCEQP